MMGKKRNLVSLDLYKPYLFYMHRLIFRSSPFTFYCISFLTLTDVVLIFAQLLIEVFTEELLQLCHTLQGAHH